jgi:hypothetical protein
MLRWIVGIYENIVKVNDHIDVKKVGKYVIHEMLESRRSVRETFGNNSPFERTITSSEGSFPLITFGNSD